MNAKRMLIFALLLFLASCTPPPATSPAAPTNLRAEAGNGEVVLRWNANGEAEVRGYNIYRSTTEDVGANGALLNTAALLTANEYTDEAVVNGVEYYYGVIAVGSGGARSPMSDMVRAVPTAPTDPVLAAPTGLTAVAEGNRVELNWNDNTEQGVGYNVYRSTTSTVDISGTPLNPTPLTASEYTDTEVETGGTYSYAVVAVANGAVSAISNVATVTVTDPGTDPGPTAPANLTAVGEGNQIHLNWNDNAEAGVSYNVYRSTAGTVDSSGTLLNPTPLTASEYTDTDVVSGVTYSYAVTAVVGGAMSPLSNVATVTLTDPEPGIGQWRTLAPSSSERQEVSYVQVGGRFYLAGGSTLHEVYDPVANSWNTIAPLPMNLDHIQGVTVDGLIYYIGGLSGFPGPHANTVYIYNPQTNSFRQGAAMPLDRGRGAGGVAVHGGKIYYAGGLHGSRAEARAVTWFDVYDPATDSWQTLPDMPTARDHFHAAVVGDVFYAIGGRDKDIDATTTVVEAYDFASGSWSTLDTELPTARGGFAAAVVGDEIVIMGGEGGGNTYETVEAYNTVSNSWRSLAAMPTARHGIQAAVCNGGVYIAAGGTVQGGQGPTNVHEVFFLDEPAPCQVEQGGEEFTTLNWTTVAPSPRRRSEAQGAAVDGKLYVFGGYNSFTPVTVLSNVDVYDPATNTWTALEKGMPTPLTHSATAVDGKDVYFAGGYVGKEGGGQTFATEEVWKYNVDNDVWTRITPLPQARGSGALVLLGRNLHFFGGSDIRRRDRNEHWVLPLDEPNSSWSSAASLPIARNHLGGVALEGKIYAIGGQQGQDEAMVAQALVSVWDPATDAWMEAARLPQPLSHISAATFVMDGRIIVGGGEFAHTKSVRSMVAYSPVTNTWTSLTSLPAARRSGVAKGIGGQIVFTTGGSPSFSDVTFKGVPTN